MTVVKKSDRAQKKWTRSEEMTAVKKTMITVRISDPGQKAWPWSKKGWPRLNFCEWGQERWWISKDVLAAAFAWQR